MSAPQTQSQAPSPPDHFVIDAPDGSCEITIDTSKAPDMTDWADHKLAPVLADWYPKISAMLPTPGYTPPKKFSVTIAPGDGVAATGGTRVTANAKWFRGELDKQGVGALVHEEVHVIQQYGGARRNAQRGDFSCGDVTNLFYLSLKLKAGADPVSSFVDSHLTSAERKSLESYRNPGAKAFAWRTNLVAALNRIIAGPSIYDAALFKGVALRETTTNLLADKPEGADLKRLNRSLLEDAYPDELSRRATGARNRGNTGWLTEGIPDYIRWFIYEPKSRGASVEYIHGRVTSEAKRGRVFEPKYSDSYRISANFLNFVTLKYDRHIVTKLNDALREGKYYDDIWADNTGKTVQQLSDAWLAQLHKDLNKLKPKPATPVKTAKSNKVGG
jgi:hypothetical protein